jgi:lysophospholipase
MNDPNMPLKVTVPTLVIAAGADPIVDPKVVERFASRLKTGSALVLPAARHEIVMETDELREAFWSAFDAFIPGETIIPAEDGPADDEEHGKGDDTREEAA